MNFPKLRRQVRLVFLAAFVVLMVMFIVATVR